MAIAYYYNEDKNPTGEWYPGVPLAHIDEARFDAMASHEQAFVEGSDWYTKTEPEKLAAQREARAVAKATAEIAPDTTEDTQPAGKADEGQEA